MLVIFPGTVLCANSLPEPLTLDTALMSANNPTHFDLVEIDQRLQALNADLDIESSYQDFRLDLTGRIREVGVSDAAPERDDGGDNAASLILSKPLYDFGQQDSREGRIGMQLQALELQKRLLIEQRRLSIMEKYFAVLNADNRYLSENEALAMGFIHYDNAREDQALGATAEIEVLRL